MLRIFIGYDDREAVCFNVLQASIIKHASVPVSITPLVLSQLKTAGLMWRSDAASGSNEFRYTRFLVPYLCDYKGLALYLDCDMLCLDDIKILFDITSEEVRYSLFCVKHLEYTYRETKYLDAAQQSFPRKNWASLMMFDCGMNRELTLEYVNSASKMQLHQFHWLPNWLEHKQIGEFPSRWNHLVGVNTPIGSPAILHWTLGAPCFYPDTLYADEWYREEREIVRHAPWRERPQIHRWIDIF